MAENNTTIAEAKTRKSGPGPMFLIAIMLGYTITYVDKSLISLVLDSAGRQGVFDMAKLGTITSAFFLSYAIVQFFIGILVDKLGSKVMLLFSLVGATLASFLFSGSQTVVTLSLCRLLAGIAHAGYPSSTTKAISDNYPPEKRSFPQSLIVVTSGIGGLVAFLVGTAIITKSGWERSMQVLGIAYAVSAVLVLLFVPKVKKVEVASDAPKLKLNYGKLVTHKKMIPLFITMFAFNFVAYGLTAWTPTYISEALGMDDGTRATYLAIAAIAITIGSVIVGKLIAGPLKNNQKRMATIMMLLSAITIVPIMFTKNATLANIFLIASRLLSTSGFVVFMGWPHRLIPSQVMGTAFGVINGIGVLGGFFAPIILAKARASSYNAMFAVIIIVTVICTVASAFLSEEMITMEEITKEAK